MSLEAQHIQQHGDVTGDGEEQEELHYRQQQQQQRQQGAGFLRRLSSECGQQVGQSSTPAAAVGRAGLSGLQETPLPRPQPPPRAASLNEETVAVAAGVTAAQQQQQQQPLWRRAAAEVLPHVLLLAVLRNMVGFWRAKLHQLAGLCCAAAGKGAGGGKAPQHG
jgi:hypothetical protein